MRSIPLTRTLRGIPPLATIAAVPDPVQRAAMVSDLARTAGTLPPAYAQLRVTSLVEALGDRRVREVAALVGLSPSRISQLTSRYRMAGVAA